MDQQSTFHSLKWRVSELERQVDHKLNEEDDNRTIKQSLELLRSRFNEFLSSQPSHAKLLQNLKQYHIKPDPSQPLDFVDLDTKREYLLAKLSDMKEAANLLNKIEPLKDFKTIPDIDLSNVDVRRITEIKLKYNFLLMKSIEVFSNYLRVLENVKRRYSNTLLEQEGDHVDPPQEHLVDSPNPSTDLLLREEDVFENANQVD